MSGAVREEIEHVLLALVRERAPERSVCPSEVARALAGDDPQAWSRLMPAVRRAAVRLMKEGRIVITRKGRPVDPDDFRGVYRLRDGAAPQGPGKSASV